MDVCSKQGQVYKQFKLLLEFAVLFFKICFAFIMEKIGNGQEGGEKQREICSKVTRLRTRTGTMTHIMLLFFKHSFFIWKCYLVESIAVFYS